MNVGTSPIDGTVYAGTVRKLKSGIETWSGKKHDITDEAFRAVAESILITDKALFFNYGKEGKRYKLTVIEVKQ